MGGPRRPLPATLRCHLPPREPWGAGCSGRSPGSCTGQKGPPLGRPGQIGISGASITAMCCREGGRDFPGCRKLECDFDLGAKFPANHKLQQTILPFLCRRRFVPTLSPWLSGRVTALPVANSSEGGGGPSRVQGLVSRSGSSVPLRLACPFPWGQCDRREGRSSCQTFPAEVDVQCDQHPPVLQKMNSRGGKGLERAAACQRHPATWSTRTGPLAVHLLG